MMPLVTIVAISYNQECYVLDALNSIKNQTYKNIQLIIADDGSTDGTKELIKQWVGNNWPDAIFLNHPVNKGVTKNLNSALPYIKGRYYQFLGCEDNLMPGKIDIQVRLLKENTDYKIVYSDMYRMDKNGVLEEKTQYQSKTYNVPHSGDVYEHLLDRCFISTPTALMHTEVLLSIGGDNEKLEINDYDFWLRASKKYKFLYHPDATVQYRVLEGSLSNRKGILRFRNRFMVFYLNYDKTYKKKFDEAISFCIKQLHSLRYNVCSLYCFKAFLKTKDFENIKYAIASIPFLFNGNKK